MEGAYERSPLKKSLSLAALLLIAVFASVFASHQAAFAADSVSKTIDVGYDPVALGYSNSSGYTYAVNFGCASCAGVISVISGATFSQNVTTETAEPDGIATNSETGNLYVSNEYAGNDASSDVFVIGGGSGPSVLGTAAVGLGPEARRTTQRTTLSMFSIMPTTRCPSYQGRRRRARSPRIATRSSLRIIRRTRRCMCPASKTQPVKEAHSSALCLGPPSAPMFRSEQPLEHTDSCTTHPTRSCSQQASMQGTSSQSRGLR